MLSIVKGGFVLNGQKTPKLLGRSAFKLSNIITYHFTGQGGGDKGWNSIGYAEQYCARQQELFGEHVVLRVFLETAGWDPKSESMFGRPPSDQGFWRLDRLRDGAREKSMHQVGLHTLDWFYKTSQSTGIVFELIIDATLKHNNISKGEIDHVIRQVGVRMGGLNVEYPKSLIIPNCRNEWNAHNKSGHTLADVNAWALRWYRDDYTSTAMKPVVCPGGGDMFTFDVGPEGGKFAMGLIHPSRTPDGRNWWDLPNVGSLRKAARGMPVGFNESMYYVKTADIDRAKGWYRNRRGWTNNFKQYSRFAEAAIDKTDYFILHDEDGVGCDTTRTVKKSQLEDHFGASQPAPMPQPPPGPQPGEDYNQKLDTIIGLLTRIDKSLGGANG